MTVIITGSAGYIRGQTSLHITNPRHTVYGIDHQGLPSHLFVETAIDGIVQAIDIVIMLVESNIK